MVQWLWSWTGRRGAPGRVARMADVENESDESLSCGVCRKVGQFTAPVSVILVFAPGMTKPYPLIPAEDYRVCSACDAAELHGPAPPRRKRARWRGYDVKRETRGGADSVSCAF